MTVNRRTKYLPHRARVTTPGGEGYVSKTLPYGEVEVAFPDIRKLAAFRIEDVSLVEDLLWPPDRAFLPEGASWETPGNIRYRQMTQRPN